jgi:hypothetical protein
MYELPTSITLGDRSWMVRNKGDFRTIIDCFNVLEDPELTKEERVLACLIIFYEDLNSLEDIDKLPNLREAYDKMSWFFNCGQDTIGAQTKYKLIDWEKDSVLICSAVNNVAKKEIRSEPYIHWWTFMGYYLAVGDCSLATVVGIRDKRAKGKKLEKYERQFVNDNPQYFWSTKTIEDQQLEDELRKIWNNGGQING